MNSLPAKALATLYVLLVVCVAAAAFYVWHVRCEGFGCIGVGVAWLAWALLFLMVSVVGLVAIRLAQRSAHTSLALRWTLAAQLALGAFLLAAWAIRSLARGQI